MKNKRNLVLSLMISTYACYFGYLILAVGIFKTKTEQDIANIIPLHLLMMMISGYVFMVLVAYLLNNEVMSLTEKMTWVAAYFSTCSLIFILFWLLKLSKVDTITPTLIKRIFQSRVKSLILNRD